MGRNKCDKRKPFIENHSSFSQATKREFMWYFFLQIMKFTYQLKTSFSILGFTKYFVISSLALDLSCILNISNILFFTRLNRLNALSIYQKFVPIDNAQNLSSGFFKQSCVVKIHNVLQNHCQSSSFESGWVGGQKPSRRGEIRFQIFRLSSE